MPRTHRIGWLPVVTSTFALGTMGVAHAADITVPGDAPTIQAAIALAGTGDRILVAAGTYAESIDFLGKELVIEGVEGAAATVLDGTNQVGFVVRISGEGTSGSVLRGLTVRGGFGEAGSNGAGDGGGILIEGTTPTIEQCIVTENSGIVGGGIAIRAGGLVLRDSSIVDNHALLGGGIATEGGSIFIEATLFTGNTATNDGGGLALLATAATLRDLSFEGNSAGSFGGAILANHAELDAAGLDVVGNGTATPFDGGQIFSTFGGGGLYATSTSGRVDRSRFTGNNAFAGGGIYVASGEGFEIVNVLLAENNAPLGAVYANSASPVLLNCTIAANDGFGLYTTFNSFPIVRNSILSGNTTIASTEIAGNGTTDVASSLIDGSAFAVAFSGENIFGAALLDPNADYAPLAGSPAIDAGTNAFVPADVLTDLLGNNRFFDDPKTPDGGSGEGALVDLGAIEFGSGPIGTANLIGDMNADGVIGAEDLAMLLGSWGPCSGACPADLDGDGQVGAADLAILLGAWGSTG